MSQILDSDLKFQEVKQDWEGNTHTGGFKFILTITGESVIFGGVFPSKVYSLGRPGEFTPGLWKKSVVELFIHDASSNCYLELNLSPSGAYWGAAFSGYRHEASDFDVMKKPIVVEKEGFVTVIQKVPTHSLLFDQFIFAQTAIISRRNSQNEISTEYLSRKFSHGRSAKEVLMSEPDFHKKELAEPF